MDAAPYWRWLRHIWYSYDPQTSHISGLKPFLQDISNHDHQVKRKRTIKHRKRIWLGPNTKLAATFVTFMMLCLSVALVTHTLVKSHWTHCRGIEIM